MNWLDPSYDTLDISVSQHKKNFTMYVKCRKTALEDGEIVGMATASSKKQGEQLAAKEALKHFGQLKEEEDSDTEVLID
jgi:dsRNA-specific ribonuclease